MDPLLPIDALRFTRDRAELADKIRKLEGRFGVYMPTRSAAEDAQLQRRDAARVRSEVTISALKSAAVHLGSLKEGRKSIVFVSDGLTGLGLDQLSLIQELTEAANTNNTAIYTLDPRGLIGSSGDVLRTLAERTGGEAYVNTNTPARALRQIVTDASAFYLLGYSSAKNPQDGKFHSIKVRVKRSGVDVRARRGYWAPNLTELERARAEAAAGDAVPADVTSALAVLSTARADRALHLWVGTRRGSGGQADVTVAWTPRAQAGEKPGEKIAPAKTVSIAARGAGGERDFEAPASAGALSFAAPPGALQLQTIVRDGDGTTIDEDTRSISVPDFGAATLAISSPVVLRARNAAETRVMAAALGAAAGCRTRIRSNRSVVRAVCGLRRRRVRGGRIRAAAEPNRRAAGSARRQGTRRHGGRVRGRLPACVYRARRLSDRRRSDPQRRARAGTRPTARRPLNFRLLTSYFELLTSCVRSSGDPRPGARLRLPLPARWPAPVPPPTPPCPAA